MARIQTTTTDNAPAASQPLLEAVQQKMGRVPNLLATMAHSPATLETYLKTSEALGGGLFSPAERERIALAVGQANRCDYCLAAHTAIGSMAGLSSEDMIDARNGTASDPKQAALVDFVRKVVDKRGFAQDSEIDAFKAAGWTDGHVLEVVANVALNTLTNYINHIAQTEVDFPAADALQTA